MNKKTGDLWGAIFRDQSGAVSIEYGFVAALITLGILSGLVILGTDVERIWVSNDAKSSAAMAVKN